MLLMSIVTFDWPCPAAHDPFLYFVPTVVGITIEETRDDLLGLHSKV